MSRVTKLSLAPLRPPRTVQHAPKAHHRTTPRSTTSSTIGIFIACARFGARQALNSCQLRKLPSSIITVPQKTNHALPYPVLRFLASRSECYYYYHYCCCLTFEHVSRRARRISFLRGSRARSLLSTFLSRAAIICLSLSFFLILIFFFFVSSSCCSLYSKRLSIK